MSFSSPGTLVNRLPTGMPCAGALSATVAHDRESPRILIVDANSLSRRVISAALEAGGYRVDEASDLVSLRELAAEEPDLILQNLVLPGYDCWEVLAWLRRFSSAIVVGYAGVLPPPCPGGLRHGLAGFLTRPFAPSHLVRSVSQYLRRKSCARPPVNNAQFHVEEEVHGAARTAANQGRAGHRVLIVEDNAFQRDQARDAFLQAGFEVVLARHGIEALEKLGRFLPDFVVTDTLMIGCDGFELCLTIRQMPAMSHLPVILTPTGPCDPVDARVAHLLGANAYVSRRSGFEGLVAAVQATPARTGPIAAIAYSA